jgi:hypothetical protein
MKYVRSRGKFTTSTKLSTVHHCPADFEPAEPGGPSASVGIAFVVSMRQATEDNFKKPAKRRKISESAPHKKALVRFLNILEAEKEGIPLGGEAFLQRSDMVSTLSPGFLDARVLRVDAGGPAEKGTGEHGA